MAVKGDLMLKNEIEQERGASKEGRKEHSWNFKAEFSSSLSFKPLEDNAVF